MGDDMLNGFKDFFEGFSRGLGLYFAERNDHTEAVVLMRGKVATKR
jgi:hypothetical protein